MDSHVIDVESIGYRTQKVVKRGNKVESKTEGPTIDIENNKRSN